MGLIARIGDLVFNWRKPIAATGLVVKATDRADPASSPQIYAAAAAPAEAQPAGSVHLRTDGAPSFRRGTAWLALALLAAATTAASTPITGTTETEANFDTTYNVPADTLKVGSVVRIRAQGIYTATTGTENHVFLVKFGTVTLAATGNIDPATNDVFDVVFEFTVRTVGATGTCVGSGVCRSGTRATASPATHFLATGSGATSTATIDTTIANAIAIAVDRQASATDGDSMRLDALTVEILG